MMLMMTTMTMMKIMRTNKSIVFSSIFNKKSTIFGSGYSKRHHMIGYSIVSDNAHAPGPSNSIYISKTNRKLSISYIPILRHYRKKKFRNNSLDQHGNSYVRYVHSEDFLLLRFTLYQYILRYGVYGGSKSQRNPIPKHVELQTISTYSNQ